MTTFEAKVLDNIPANRLVGLGGTDRNDNPEEGWDTIYLVMPKLGQIPDLVSTADLQEGSEISVTIKNNPVWQIEAAENIPAGTLVQCTDDGRVQNFNPAVGSYIGFTTHSAEAGEIVSVVRKYGQMPQEQIEASTFSVPEQKEFPKHTGGGYYELSNGEKVQGKDAAIEAENALKEG